MNSKGKNKSDEIIPLKFHLSQNYPNPFKEKTIIKYCVAYRTKVNITVLNLEGKVIENLVDEIKNAGTYETEFDACRYYSGEHRTKQDLPGGTYFIRLKAGEYNNVKEINFLP